MRKPTYGNNSVVSFIDILGFAALTEQEKMVPDVIKAVNLLRDRSRYRDYDPSLYTADSISFSDTTIRVVRPSPKPPIKIGILFLEILQILHAQIDLYHQGILIRGGLSYGKMYVSSDKSTFFGPAFNRAYKIESQVSVYPRIVVDKNIITKFRSYKALHSSIHTNDDEKDWLMGILTRDSDGQYYIDMFKGCLSEVDEESLPAFIQTSHQFLSESLEKYRRNFRVLPKYLWLAQKHNEMIRGLSERAAAERGLHLPSQIVRMPEL